MIDSKESSGMPPPNHSVCARSVEAHAIKVSTYGM